MAILKIVKNIFLGYIFIVYKCFKNANNKYENFKIKIYHKAL